MTDYGTGYVPWNGSFVSLTECPTCGGLMSTSGQGHSAAGTGSDTERHKAAIAERERRSR